MGRARSLCLVFATVAVLAGCAGGQSSPGQPGSGPPASTATATSPGVEQAAPAAVPEQLRFAGRTLDGKDFSGESLAGKAAVLWFWAPWCPKCQREAPAVASAAQANAGKVEFVGVAAQDDLAAMQGFVTKYQVGSWPLLLGGTGLFARSRSRRSHIPR